jgi:hypothetical protein
MPIEPDYPRYLIYSILAAAGGAARYVQSYIDTGTFKWTMLFAQVMVSAFTGLMLAEFTLALGANLQLAFCAAGAGGFVGTHAMDVIVDRIKGAK